MDADTRKGVKLLDTSAVARRDNKPLGTVDDFAAQQRRTLEPALDKLSPANRERAAESLSLLDGVRESISRAALPEAARRAEVVAGVLGDRAQVLGALALVVSEADRTFPTRLVAS